MHPPEPEFPEPKRPNAWIPILRGGLAATACLLVLQPLATVPARPRGEDLLAHVVPGWILFGVVLVVYAIAARRGRVLEMNGSGHRLRAFDLLLLVAFPLFLTFFGSGFTARFGDNTASRTVTYQILTEGSLDLSSIPELQKGERSHYSTVEIEGRLLPGWPLGTPLLAVPHAAVSLFLSDGEVNTHRVSFWAKHFAALATVAATCFLFLGVRARYGEPAALGASLVFALATTSFSVVSQGMWNFTGEIFFVTAALGLLLPEPLGRKRLAGAGACMALAFFCRPSSLLMLGVIGLIVWWRGRRLPWTYFVTAGLVALAVVAFQYDLYGHPLGGYGLKAAKPGRWGANPVEGFLGNLVSPGRGIAIYFPYLVLFVGTLWSRRKSVDAWHVGALSLVFLNYTMISTFTNWWGGVSTGPRLMTESAPFLALITVPWWAGWSRLRGFRFLVAGSVAAAIAIQLVGAYSTAVRMWHHEVARPAGLYGVEAADRSPLWWWRDGQIAAAFRPRPRPKRIPEGPAWEPAPERSFRVDLSEAANARYDLHNLSAFEVHSPRPTFDRLDPHELNRRGALFHFERVGRPNAVSTVGAPLTRPIPLKGQRASRVHAALTALAASEQETIAGTPVVAELEVTYADGEREILPIRLHREVFPFAHAQRRTAIPEERVYLGLSEDDDAVVHTSWELGRPDTGIRSLRLRAASLAHGQPVDVSLLALTLES